MRRLLMLIISALSIVNVWAQPNPMTPLPVDSAVRTGTLPNGLTYYIRHNEKPKGQADFYILHNVGAIQEDDSQQGLAHFLEHMAFNGTKNLPGKALINYLQTIGVKFGADLNAGTSWDYTQYNIDAVPTTRPGIIDTALLILHDWSHFIALEPKEIDSERGVIIEELRTRDVASWRMTIALIQAAAKGTLYEHRNLIGYLDDLKNFQHKELEAFYQKWYRPEYQSIVIVGDLDAEAVEAKLKTLMADIPASAPDAPKKAIINIPNNQEPQVDIFTDPEMQNSLAILTIKNEAMPKEAKNTMMGVTISLLQEFVSTMAYHRLNEIAMKPDAPFINGSLAIGSLGICPTQEPLMFQIVTQDGQLARGIESLYTELKRIAEHGFTAGEFERARQDMMSEYERSYTNRNDRKNNQYVQMYLSNYRDNTPIMDAEQEWQINQLLIGQLQVDMVNKYVKELITNENQVMFVAAPKREGVVNPTQQEILAIRERVNQTTVEPYVDNTVKEPLIDSTKVLKGAKITTEKTNKLYGTTEWELENGAKVIVKPTKFKADELRLSVFANGGLAILNNNEYLMGQYLSSLNQFSGVGKFSMNELNKQLSGKQAAIYTQTSDYSSGMSGSCSPKDVETMLQLLYLNFTQPRFDANDYKTWFNMLSAQLTNLMANPNYVMIDEFMKTRYGNNPRRQALTMEKLESFDFTKFPSIYSKLFPGANGFTFIFAGNINPNELKPLVEKYIGSIPKNKKPAKFVDDQVRQVPGVVKHDFTTPMQQPKVRIIYAFAGDVEYTLKEEVALDFLAEALDIRYTASIREDKGGSYGISVQPLMRFRPAKEYTFMISFDTNKEMADELMGIIRHEIEKIAKEGPLPEDIEKNRESVLKDWKTGLEENRTWLSAIKELKISGLDKIADYENTIRNLTYKDVQEMAVKILKDNNLVHVIMRPEITEQK